MNTLIIGNNIKRWRQFKGMKQEQLARELKITRSTLSRLENGKGDYDLRTVARIATLLGLEMLILLSAKPASSN